VLPGETVAELGVIDTTLAGTVTVTEAEIEVLAIEVAVIVAVRSCSGGLLGGMYVADAALKLLRVPLPEAGERLHVTPCCEESFCTVAVSTWVVPAGTVAVTGATETAIGSAG
jgi:hypothetical protein